MPNMPPMASAYRPSSSKLRRNEVSGGAGMLTAVLVAISLVLFTLSVRENGSGVLSTVSNAAQTVVSPLRVVGAGMTAPFAGMRNIMRNLTADEKTLLDLKAENERLAARNVELEEAQVAVEQLQALLDLKSTYNLQSTGARVIAGSNDSWAATVTIDKGSASGVAIGMPVVNQGGAVGQVIRCSAATSVVRLLTDERSSVSAMVQSSRAQGMLEGSADGTLSLMYVRTDQTVSVGDIVVTGGLGGVFPKGLPIGKVSALESAPGSTYYGIVVEPFANASSLEEVLVVTSLTEEQEATAQDFSDADAADKLAASGAGWTTSDGQSADGQDGDASGQTAEGSGTGSGEADASESSEDGTASDDDGVIEGGYTSPYHVDGGEE